MSIETLCYGSAVLGTILTIIGRRLLFHEAASISDGWRWAVRLLPLADIMFLARYWDTAKTGAFTSLVGLGFLLPLGAKTMWDKKNMGPADYEERGKAILMESKLDIYSNLKGELDARVDAKQRKLQQLNGHLGAWYSNMSARRASLTNATPEQLAAFNTEAEAYKALHQVTKDEVAELQKMLNKQARGFQGYTNEDFGRYVVENEKRRERQARMEAKKLQGTGEDPAEDDSGAE
jgi:signal transduction histidine kinase